MRMPSYNEANGLEKMRSFVDALILNAPDHDASQKCIHRTQGVAVSPIRCRYCSDLCNFYRVQEF